MNSPAIRKARRDDLQEILSLLKANKLPVEGVEDALPHFLVAELEGKIVGAIGLELYDSVALLRSAVVEKNLQRAGIGSRLYG